MTFFINTSAILDEPLQPVRFADPRKIRLYLGILYGQLKLKDKIAVFAIIKSVCRVYCNRRQLGRQVHPAPSAADCRAIPI
jgi:hypothetical protein